MSLVAYEGSSDEESGGDNVEEFKKVNGHISDDEDLSNKGLHVFGDASSRSGTNGSRHAYSYKPTFSNLPAPINISPVVIEEDDEFLHKREALSTEKPPPIPKAPIKITVPSLSEFKDLDEGNTTKKSKSFLEPSKNAIGLLNILPRPKHEVFLKTPVPAEESKKPLFTPNSVKNRITKPANLQPLKTSNSSKCIINTSDSEESDCENDFFSLNTETDLPEVSSNEINSMVAKKAAQMAEAVSKIDEFTSASAQTESPDEDPADDQNEIVFDEKALHALVGSRAKRRKVDDVQIVELSSEQVLPNKDEWLRTALASATSYQPKGVLVDEEPAPGTRKKHQITYLAHQAKANEQELQAMWATNRHTRRQTQSKYGF